MSIGPIMVSGGGGFSSVGQQTWKLGTTVSGQDYTARRGAVSEIVDGVRATRTNSTLGGYFNMNNFGILFGDTAISGKKYFEFYVGYQGTGAIRTGIGNTSTTTANVASDTNSVHLQNGASPMRTAYNNAIVSLTGTGATGDVIMWACDSATGEVWVGVNGTWLNSGDPTAGTGEVATLAAGTYYPFVFAVGNDQLQAIHTELFYAPPTDFSAL